MSRVVGPRSDGMIGRSGCLPTHDPWPEVLPIWRGWSKPFQEAFVHDLIAQAKSNAWLDGQNRILWDPRHDEVTSGTLMVIRLPSRFQGLKPNLMRFGPYFEFYSKWASLSPSLSYLTSLNLLANKILAIHLPSSLGPALRKYENLLPPNTYKKDSMPLPWNHQFFNATILQTLEGGRRKKRACSTGHFHLREK